MVERVVAQNIQMAEDQEEAVVEVVGLELEVVVVGHDLVEVAGYELVEEAHLGLAWLVMKKMGDSQEEGELQVVGDQTEVG